MVKGIKEGFNKLIAYIKNSCKTSGSFMASFGVKLFTSLSLVCLVLAFTIMLAKDQFSFMSNAAGPDPFYIDSEAEYYKDKAIDKNGSETNITLIGSYDFSRSDAPNVVMGYLYSNGVFVLDGDGYFGYSNTNNMSSKLGSTNKNLVKKIVASYDGFIPRQYNSSCTMDNFFSNLPNLCVFEKARMDFSEVTSMKNMFDSSFDSTKEIELDLSNLDLSSATNLLEMFKNAKFKKINISGWTLNPSSNVSIGSLLQNNSNLEEINMSGWINGNQISKTTSIFYGLNKLKSINMKDTDLGNSSTVHGYEFYQVSNLKEIVLPKSVGGNISLSYSSYSSYLPLRAFDVNGEQIDNTKYTYLPYANKDGKGEFALKDAKRKLCEFNIQIDEYSSTGGDLYTTDAAEVYYLNSSKTLRAYYFTNSYAGNILVFEGTGTIENQSPFFDYAREHGDDIVYIFISDEGFKPSGNANNLFSGLNNSSSDGIKFNETDSVNFDKCDFSNVTSMKYFFSSSKLDNVTIPAVNDSVSIDIDGIFNDVTVNVLDMSKFNLTNKSNASSIFSNIVINDKIITPISMGSYSNTINLPSLASRTNYRWKGFNIVSGDEVPDNTEYNKLTDKSNVEIIKAEQQKIIYKGITYEYEDMVYSWDVSKNQNGSIMAYYFYNDEDHTKYDGGTLLFMNTTSDPENDTNEMFNFNGFITYRGFSSVSEFNNPSWVITDTYYDSYLINPDIIDAFGKKDDETINATPWSLIDHYANEDYNDDNEQYVNKVVFANKVKIDKGRFLLANLTKCKEYDLVNLHILNKSNDSLVNSGLLFNANNANIIFNDNTKPLKEIYSLYNAFNSIELTDNLFNDYPSLYYKTSDGDKNVLDLTNTKLVNNKHQPSGIDKYYKFMNSRDYTKIYVTHELSYTNEDSTELISKISLYSDTICLYEVYASDDTFLGYELTMVDDSYSKNGKHASYVVPRHDLGYYAFFKLYTTISREDPDYTAEFLNTDKDLIPSDSKNYFPYMLYGIFKLDVRMEQLYGTTGTYDFINYRSYENIFRNANSSFFDNGYYMQNIDIKKWLVSFVDYLITGSDSNQDSINFYEKLYPFMYVKEKMIEHYDGSRGASYDGDMDLSIKYENGNDDFTLVKQYFNEYIKNYFEPNLSNKTIYRIASGGAKESFVRFKDKIVLKDTSLTKYHAFDEAFKLIRAYDNGNDNNARVVLDGFSKPVNGASISFVADTLGNNKYDFIPRYLSDSDISKLRQNNRNAYVNVKALNLENDDSFMTYSYNDERSYTGSAITYSASGTLGNDLIKVIYKNNEGEDVVLECGSGKDYTLSFSNNINPGLGTITVTGNGTTVVGTKTLNFNIKETLDFSSIDLLNGKNLDKYFDGNTNGKTFTFGHSDNASIPSNMTISVVTTFKDSLVGDNKELNVSYTYHVDGISDSDLSNFYEITDPTKKYYASIILSTLFTIDGIDYMASDLVYKWDVSEIPNGGYIYAYYFTTNGGTVVLNDESGLNDKYIKAFNNYEGLNNCYIVERNARSVVEDGDIHLNDYYYSPWSVLNVHSNWFDGNKVRLFVLNTPIHFRGAGYFFGGTDVTDITISDKYVFDDYDGDDIDNQYNYDMMFDGLPQDGVDIKFTTDVVFKDFGFGYFENDWTLDLTGIDITNNVKAGYYFIMDIDQFDKVYLPDHLYGFDVNDTEREKLMLYSDQLQLYKYAEVWNDNGTPLDESDDKFLGYTDKLIDKTCNIYHDNAGIVKVPSYLKSMTIYEQYAFTYALIYNRYIDNNWFLFGDDRADLIDDILLNGNEDDDNYYKERFLLDKMFSYIQIDEISYADDYEDYVLFDNDNFNGYFDASQLRFYFWDWDTFDNHIFEFVAFVSELFDYIKEDRLGSSMSAKIELIDPRNQYSFTDPASELGLFKIAANDFIKEYFNKALEEENNFSVVNYLDTIKLEINAAFDNAYKLFVNNLSEGYFYKKVGEETTKADLITNFNLASVSCDLLTNAFSSSNKNIVRETDNYYVIKNPSLIDTFPNNNIFIMYDLDEEANIPFYYASTDDIVSYIEDEFTAYSITDFKTLFDNGSRTLSDSDVETYLKSATITTTNSFKMFTDKNLPGVLITTTISTSETYVALPKEIDVITPTVSNEFDILIKEVGEITYKAVNKFFNYFEYEMTVNFDEDTDEYTDNEYTYKVTSIKLDISDDNSNPYKNKITVSGINSTYSYTGSEVTFDSDIVVTYKNNYDEDIALVKDKDYTISYSNNTDAGINTASVTITGIGNCKGTRTINFSIDEAMFTIDGVSYKRTEYVTSWDISRDENDSVYAYLFKDPLDSNELTLVFNNELLDKKVTSDLSSLVDGTDNIVKKYNGCVDIIVKSNDHVTDPAVITPWSLYDDTHTSTIEHVAFNNMIHFDSLTFMFAKLYGLNYIKLEDNKIDFELINSNNDDYSSYYAFYDDYNLEIDLDGEIKLPKELFDFSPSTGTHYNWILDFSDATFTSGNNNVIDDYDLGIRTSNYDSLKIFIPEDISSLGDYAKDAFDLDQAMFGVYDSDDNFLGYSPYMIDQNDRSFDKVISSVTHVPSYVVPCDELGIYACYELLLDTSLSDDLKLAFTYKFFIYLFNELYDATNYDILLDDIFDSPLVSKNNLKNIITSIYWNIASGYSDNVSLVYELVDYIKEERLGHTLNSHMSLIGSDKEYDYTNSSNEFTKTRRYLNDGLMILANPELEDPNANTTPPTTLNYLDNIKVNITNAVSVFNHALSNVFKLAILNSSGDVIDYVRDNDITNAIINHCSLFDDDFLSIAEVATTQELLDELYKSSDNTCKWFLTSDNKYIVIKNVIDEEIYVVYEMPGEKIEYYHIGYAPTSGFGLDDSMVTTSIPGTFNESDLLSSSYIEANMNKYIGIPDVVYGGYDMGFLFIGSDNASDSYYAFPIESLVYQPVMDTSFSTLATKVGNWVFKAIANGLFTMEDSSYDYNKISINVGSLSIADSNAKVTVNLPLPSQAYTGSAITIDDLVVVTYENNDGEEHILEQDKDYTLTYDNNVNVGQAKITITGDGTNVTGSRDVYFNITRALDLSSVRLLDNALTSNPNLLNKVYDGNNIVTSLNNLELTSSDNSSIPSNMKVIVNGTYDNSNAGSNKDVTLTYTYKDLSGNDIDTTYYTITDSSVTYKGNISKKKIDVTFNTDNISKTYDKTADINIGITCDASDIISGDTLTLPTSVHGNFARSSASQLDSDIIDITLDSNWYNIDTINANYELDSSDAPDTIAGLINKKEVLYDLSHSLNDTVNVYHYMKTFDGNKDYMLNTILDDTSVIAGDDIGIVPGVYLVSKSSQVGSYHLSDGDVSFDPGVSLFGSDSNNYFIKQPKDTPKFSNLYLEICNKLINDGGSGNINITMPPNPTYTGNEFDIKSQLIIRDNSCYPSYTLVYGSDKDYILKYFDEDGNEISSIKDAGIYSIKVIGQNNYSGEKDLDFYVYKKSISRDDIVLAQKNITKVKDGLDYEATYFDNDELHLTYTNNLVSPNEVVPIYYDLASFVKDDYSDILYEANENTETTLRNIKFEDIFIDDDYTNNYEFDYDITSMSNTLFVDNANYLIDDVDPRILDISIEEMKAYGRGMPITFNVIVSEDIGDYYDDVDTMTTAPGIVLKYKIGNRPDVYSAALSELINLDQDNYTDRYSILKFESTIDSLLDYGMPKDQCGVYPISIDSLALYRSSFIKDSAGNDLDLDISNIDGINPFDINEVNVNTKGFVIDISHVKSERDASDSGYDKSYYKLETDANLVLSGATDNDKDISLLSKLKLTITNASDDTITKTYTYDDLDYYGALDYTRNELGKDYDIVINLSCLTFHDDDDSDDIEHLGLFRKNDTSGYRVELSIDEDALTNDTGNTNIEAKTSNIVIFNAPDFVLDDDNDKFNPNKYFTFVYTDALGVARYILLAPNGDITNGYKFINALTGEEVYFYQDDKISILNDIDVSDTFNEFHFDIISDLKGLVLDTLVMNKFGMDAALNIDYVFSDVTNFLRDNVINNIDKSVYDVISDLYLHYDSMEGPDEFYHFIARNNGIKNIILRVRTIDDITRDVLKVINDNSKNVLDKDSDYIFINPYAKDFSIIDPNGDIGNYVPDGGAAGDLTYVLRELIAHDDDLNLLPEGTFSKELERRNTINPITKDNLKQTLLDIALDSYNGFSNVSKMKDLLDKDPLTDSDIEDAMIAYQKMPSWVVKNYLDNNLVVNDPKTFKYYVDKLFDLYYGVKDDAGAIITPGVIDGYGTKDAVSDNENFEVFGLINKVDKPNDSDKVFLDVRKITDSNELDDVRSELNNYYINKSLSFDDKVLTPYDIKLYVKNLSSGNKNYVQPKSGENILVKLELDPLFYYTDFKIYHTTHKDDGTVDEIDSLPLRKDLDLTNNKYYVYFEADSFSTFTITCDAKTIVVSEDGDIDSEGKYLGGSITPNGLIPILDPNVTKTKLFTITLNNDYKAEIYKDFASSPFMTVDSNKMITLDNLDSDSDNIYLLVKYIYDPKVDPADPEPTPDKPKDLSSATITIQVLSNKKFIDGYKDNTFRPNEYMTRAEFAKVISSLSSNFIYSDRDKDARVATNTYSDIKDTDWYKDYVGYLTDRNILRGYSANNGTKNIYKGNNYIKRSEVSKILTSMFDIKSNDISIINYANEIKGRWYENSVSKLIKAGYLRGYSDGTIKAENYMTRAEVVALINRVVKNDYANINPALVKGYKDISKEAWYYDDIIAASN